MPPILFKFSEINNFEMRSISSIGTTVAEIVAEIVADHDQRRLIVLMN